MDEFKVHLGKNISHLRRQKGRTQEQFADDIKIKKTTIGSIEEGRCIGDIRRIKMIAVHFGVTLDDLIFKKIWK